MRGWWKLSQGEVRHGLCAHRVRVKMRRFRAIGLWAGLSMLAAACGPMMRSPERSEVMVAGGRPTREGSRLAARSSTLALTSAELLAEGRSFCSATLVTHWVAVTAAHCVTDRAGNIERNPILAVHGLELGHDSRTVAIAAIAVHARWRGSIHVAPPVHDLAVLRLAEALPRPAKPTPLATAAQKIAVGERLTIAGFGVTRTREVDDTGTLRQVDVKVRSVDEISRIIMVRGAERPGTLLARGHGRERARMHAGSCAGDSGGPAYFKDDQEKSYLVGISSFGFEEELQGEPPGVAFCIGDNGYTDVRAYPNTLARVVASFDGAASSLEPWGRFDESGLSAWSD